MSTATRAIAIIGALASGGASVLQFFLMNSSMVAEGYSPLGVLWRFLGYFTILTNLFVTWIWARAVFRPNAPQPRLEGAGATAIIMVGIIYHLLLASRWNPQGWEWVADFIHHTCAPIVFALYWLLRPHGKLSWRDALLFVIWPLGYFVYAMARGAIDGWYAYYFLDPKHMTLASFLLSFAAQSAAFLIFGLALVGLDKAFGAFGRRAALA